MILFSPLVRADLQLIVGQWGRSANGSIHAHSHLCLVHFLGTLNLLLFADGKGVGVQVLYCSKDWAGDEASQQPACQQRCQQQYRCTAIVTVSIMVKVSCFLDDHLGWNLQLRRYERRVVSN